MPSFCVVELWPTSEVYVRNTSYVLSLSFYLRNFFRVIELWPNPEVDVHNASYVLSSSFYLRNFFRHQ